MTKEELADELAAKTETSQEEAVRFIDALSEVLADYFRHGEKVVIAELGSFYVQADRSVQFNPSAKFKELIE